jgi:hypothetical protein
MLPGNCWPITAVNRNHPGHRHRAAGRHVRNGAVTDKRRRCRHGNALPIRWDSGNSTPFEDHLTARRIFIAATGQNRGKTRLLVLSRNY